MISKDALARDLPLYLPGLSTTLSFASLSVQSPFLQLLEKHIMNLDGQALRPALKALILALLPGLEEETSEEFERTLNLVDGFKKAVRSPNTEKGEVEHSNGDEFFWQCFFLASITSNSRRLGALAYLIRKLPRLGPPSQDSTANGSAKNGHADNPQKLAEIVTSPEPGLLLRCFAAGLADEQPLVQRGFLDLLVTHLPLHSTVLQMRVKTEDLDLLISAASRVVARRDMSLNRRLWAWLLGPEPAGNDDAGGLESPKSTGGETSGSQAASRTQYFEQYGLRPLTRTLLKLIARDVESPLERARPFRICLSMMDRWEIGGLVVPDIFLPVVSSVRRYKDRGASKAAFTEVLRSASVFFDGVESGLIWGEIIGLLDQALAAEKLSMAERTDKLTLVSFIIGHFNVREEEMLLVHAPLTVLIVLILLEKLEEKDQPPEAIQTNEVYSQAIDIATDLIHLIPERAFSRGATTKQQTAADASKVFKKSNSDLMQVIMKFYTETQGNLEAYAPPLPPRVVSELILRKGGNITCQSLSKPVSSADTGNKLSLLVLMLSKIQRSTTLDTHKLLSSMHNRLSSPSKLSFSAFTSSVALGTSLYNSSHIEAEDLSELVDPFVRSAWSFLAASHPKYHVETVRSLWLLQNTLTLSNQDIEASICSLIAEQGVDGTFATRDADPAQRFGILWTHTLQDNAGHLERKMSKSSTNEMAVQQRGSGLGNHEVMLARPLFFLLDALLDERTQLFMTIRSWIQTLVGIDKFVIRVSQANHLLTLSTDFSTCLL